LRDALVARSDAHAGGVLAQALWDDDRARPLQRREASGTIDPSEPEKSRFEVVIDVASLNTHNAQRDNDLRGSYFLEIDEYPTITFASTGAERIGDDYTLSTATSRSGAPPTRSRCRSSGSAR
jgi:hypothetical protein